MGKKGGPLSVCMVGLAHLHPRPYMSLLKALPLTRVVAAMDPDAKLREGFCKEFGVRGYAALDELLEHEDVDMAAVFLPHADCPAAAVKCAGRGIHLLVEKPVAATAEGAVRIVEAAHRHGVKFTTGYYWRLHPAAREFRRLIAEGLIGRVTGAEGRFAAGGMQRYVDGGSPWMLDRKKSGGGPMHNLGVHWIDLFRFLLDDEVVETSGQTVKVNTEYDVEDGCFAHLRFSRGAVAALDVSYGRPAAARGADMYLYARGTEGAIWWSAGFGREKEVLHVVSDSPRLEGGPCRDVEVAMEPAAGYAGSMGRECVRLFAECILHGGDPPVTGRDAVAALDVVEAIYRSAREKRVVEVPNREY